MSENIEDSVDSEDSEDKVSMEESITALTMDSRVIVNEIENLKKELTEIYRELRAIGKIPDYVHYIQRKQEEFK